VCYLLLAAILDFVWTYFDSHQPHAIVSSLTFKYWLGSRYLRLKRQNQVYFVMCKPDDTVGYLKQQVALANKKEWKAEQMRVILPKDNTVLEDSEKLEEHEEIKNETELYVVFQISEQEWESVNIESTQAVGEASS
jgi:prolyl oligopeptidase PreP (S9A serine peptidase family)